MRKIKTKKSEQVFFDDVEVGTEIPALVKKYELRKWVTFLAVQGDFYGAHYDYKAATEQGDESAPGPHGFGHQYAAHLSQLVTDWIGPNGVLKKFSCLSRAPQYDGTVVTMQGKVINKYTKNGDNYVECELWGNKEDGTLAISGSATVILPSRS